VSSCTVEAELKSGPDRKKMSWVHEKEHVLKKKGTGYGIYQSDVICSTVG